MKNRIISIIFGMIIIAAGIIMIVSEWSWGYNLSLFGLLEIPFLMTVMGLGAIVYGVILIFNGIKHG